MQDIKILPFVFLQKQAKNLKTTTRLQTASVKKISKERKAFNTTERQRFYYTHTQIHKPV